jgi:hypothetical protein
MSLKKNKMTPNIKYLERIGDGKNANSSSLISNHINQRHVNNDLLPTNSTGQFGDGFFEGISTNDDMRPFSQQEIHHVKKRTDGMSNGYVVEDLESVLAQSAFDNQDQSVKPQDFKEPRFSNDATSTLSPKQFCFGSHLSRKVSATRKTTIQAETENQKDLNICRTGYASKSRRKTKEENLIE